VPRFFGIFLALGFSRFDGESALPPTASNASRWALAKYDFIRPYYITFKLGACDNHPTIDYLGDFSMDTSTTNLLVSGLMGLIGGLITIPINTIASWWLKREEQKYQHKLDVIAKQRELILQHKLEIQRTKRSDELSELKISITKLEKEFRNGRNNG